MALAMLVFVSGILVAAWLDTERFFGSLPGRVVIATLGSLAVAAIWIGSGASVRVVAAWFVPATVLLVASYMIPGPAGYVVVAATGTALAVLTFSDRVRQAWFARLPAIFPERALLDAPGGSGLDSPPQPKTGDERDEYPLSLGQEIRRLVRAGARTAVNGPGSLRTERAAPQ